MSELNKNSQERLAMKEGYLPETQQHFVRVHEKSSCGYLRRKYSFPLWQILLWNILLFAIIVVVILLSPGVLRGKKAVTPNDHKRSEGVSCTTEPATTIQPQNTTTQPRNTTTQPRNTTTQPRNTTTNSSVMECGVAVVGGGVDGLLLAYMLLVKQNETSVCIFEKENRLGGQIYDHFFSEASDIAVGLGHLVVGNNLEERRVVGRVLEFRAVFNWVRSLARVEARGVFEDGFDNLRQRVFPALNRSDTVKDMADDVSKANASLYITAGDFVTGYLSPEGRELLEVAYDLKYPLYEVNPESFMKFLKEKRLDEEFRRFDQRPEKGLSELVWLLKKKVEHLNGSIYFPETVTSVMTEGSTFLLHTTNNSRVIANKTVLAVGPAALKDMEGDVIQNIISHKILKSIVSVPAFFGAAVYKDAWWEDSIAPKDMFISNGNCLGITMPYKKSKNGSHVLQTIANTGYCSVQWGFKLNRSKDLVDREMKSALEYKFGRNISDAVSTVYKYWENGFWYVQKAGTKFSVEEIRNWAKRPLPGSDVFLIGKAFYNFGGSLEDTFRSINETLVEGWQTELKL